MDSSIRLSHVSINAVDNSTLFAADKATAPLIHSRLVWIITAFAALWLAHSFLERRRLPPGVKPLPKIWGLPYIGAPWGVPVPGAESAWHFGSLHKKYGPIFAWEVFGTLHVWIETDQIARDLFVRRGKLYSDRNHLPAAPGIREGSEFLPLMGAGEKQIQHKNFIHALNRNANAQDIFFGYPALENRNTLVRLLDRPDIWSEQIITHCARIAGRIAWGDVRHGTKLLHVVPRLLHSVSPAGPIINLLTFLDHLPTFLSPWKQEELRRKQQLKEAFVEAQDDVIRRCKEGTAEPSWTKLWVDQAPGLERTKLDKVEIAHATGSNALVAIVTIGSPLHTFITAICHYPSWLPRLQEEIDRVCGDRLPLMSDMPMMPVLRAVVKETLRWRQPTPAGVPHCNLEDDVYEGYFIPKGTILHANHFMISRDPNVYPDPTEWRPERFLEPSWPTYKEPLSEFPTIRGDAGFGYGVRGCPGIDLVSTELYTAIGSLAWAFNIRRKEGYEGYKNPVPWYQTNPWVITMLSQFECDFIPRSKEREMQIRAMAETDEMLVKIPGQQSEGQFAKWDIYRPEDTTVPFDWKGLTAPAPLDQRNRKYPAGV
ncbi:putative P450 monooxygenase [Piedraia hortae CBS 480.64]|uniref:Putative P450 monooxygenase n=1 Tax=Piedraia hortae CBS 480.64 TaxID=1314780 RepID=A0A6A7BR30_9PEZI|nr:putative P450 monooxygenase [Piedraia hortae CBS 480.64]